MHVSEVKFIEMNARLVTDKERINGYKRACLRYKREYIVRGLYTKWLIIDWQQNYMTEEGYGQVCRTIAEKYQQEIDRYKGVKKYLTSK